MFQVVVQMIIQVHEGDFYGKERQQNFQKKLKRPRSICQKRQAFPHLSFIFLSSTY